jgi:hypothetical protein
MIRSRENKILEIESELSNIRRSIFKDDAINEYEKREAEQKLARINRDMLEIKMDLVRDSQFNRDFFYIYIEIENLRNALLSASSPLSI